jgi:hypothetical protein
MAAKILSAPKTIQLPVIDYSDTAAWQAQEEKYVQDVKEYCLKSTRNQGDPYVGKILGIPCGDGQASYMVHSTKPLQLVHLPIGDAWESPYAELFTLNKLKEQIDQVERIEGIFAKAKAEQNK